MSEDPRELARRLAAQAKERLGQDDAAAEDPRELARRLAAQAKAKAKPTESDPGRPLSAAEALARARAERRSAPSRPAPRPAAPAPRHAAPAPPPPSRNAPADDEGLEPTMVIGDAAVLVARLLGGLLPNAVVVHQSAIDNLEVFKALWRAHLARGKQEGDAQLVATSSVLLDAVARVRPGTIVAAKVSVNGSEWAAWVDVERSVLLAVAQPASVFLAGT